MTNKKRTCWDKQRYHALKSLREWRDSVHAEENVGRMRERFFERGNVRGTSHDQSWTSWFTVTLTDGTEFCSDSRPCGWRQSKWTWYREIHAVIDSYYHHMVIDIGR